ncbi:hypothetical protein GCM10027445_50470 [Amycolatopsis endophytica]|uniref:Uncharacterized protein n=1 Tax=Amycolatopsis endophytica TaxID=860233 RepID=A0A853AYU7_9PSEU|nr:hypothetical protein [Amycolatopsis endophytica]NYI87880.1 hypothetical protein [Amycolatopsis endophytica]
MSAPEHRPTGHTGQTSGGAPVVYRAGEVVVHQPVTRTARAVSWAGYHLGELAGLIVPIGLGAAVWEGFYALSVLTALGWTAHEVNARRTRRGPSTKDGGRA